MRSLVLADAQRDGGELDVIQFTNPDNAAVYSASRILTAKYKGYVDFNDVQQELYLWLFQNYEKAESWRESREEAHAQSTLIRALRNAGERYCRNEKAEQSGFHTDDEFFYSIPMVSDLLQLHFDDDWMLPSGLELTRTTGGTPAREGGNLMAMVADVGRAYGALPLPDRTLLREIYNNDDKGVADAIATKSLDWDCSLSAANSRIRRVVGRLRAQLGGAAPWRKDDE